jgi:hypothetical protein
MANAIGAMVPKALDATTFFTPDLIFFHAFLKNPYSGMPVLGLV